MLNKISFQLVRSKVTKFWQYGNYFLLSHSLAHPQTIELELSMPRQTMLQIFMRQLSAFFLIAAFVSNAANASETHRANPGNFGLPGIIDLPNAKRFEDGDLVITHQNNSNLFMTGISFQALPRLGVSFRYGGQGHGGKLAQGRVNWDRSFDAHISVFDESTYFPAISFGLRDFIGTGWYSSEYFVGTKSIGDLEITGGLGFGRLSGRNSFTNPFSTLSSRFSNRDGLSPGYLGGTLGAINWFQGNASPFYGFSYRLGDKIAISSEYTPDLMSRESAYLDIKSPWNFGMLYQLNNYISLSAQYLYGSEVSLAAHVAVNPAKPPLMGGKELAPVPMRLRGKGNLSQQNNDKSTIRKVLAADRFDIHKLKIEGDTVNIIVTNTKFRSTAQAVGRVASTLQRFTSNDIKFADISFYSNVLQTARYKVDLEKISLEQFSSKSSYMDQHSIEIIDAEFTPLTNSKERFTWGIGPYIAHRLFNPDLPLSMETGIEFQGGYQLAQGLKVSGALRKSILTNLTDNQRRSNSELPRVHSDWPLYDFAGQSGHIHALSLSYFKNVAPGFYGRAHAGLLEPFFAGIGGEILYKPVNSPFAIGIDIHKVRKRDYDMRFDLRDYSVTIGHLSAYYDAGSLFNVEINAGRYLAGDWGVTTTVSRKFGSGWEVGGYATFTDVPFAMFGEGSFDKAIFVSIPIDWITSTPNQGQRILTLRPITRDGGANMASARSLYRHIEHDQSANFKRGYGRLWK